MFVLIADDHANVRRGLREIVADAFSGSQFSEAANGIEVMIQLAKSPCGVLLLDINMPGRTGLEVLQDVKHIYPLLPVIMVSVQPEPPPTSTRTAPQKNWPPRSGKYWAPP